MKQKSGLSTSFFLLFFSLYQLSAQTTSSPLSTGDINQVFCGTDAPDQQWEARFQELIKEAIAERGEKKEQSVPYIIPVIIHVVHGGQSVGTYPNLAQGQLVSQIQVLNNDFGGIGYSSGNYPATAFSAWAANEGLPASGIDGLGRVKIANCNVQFCLATMDTLGNLLTEPGIDRINYVSKGWSNPASFGTSTSLRNFINGTVKPQTIWNVSKYLNIWVTDNAIGANSLLGYATFPLLPNGVLQGISSSLQGSSTSDGYWCYAKAFGSITTYPSGTYYPGYERGRTSTHEIGHWLGLRHIGGDGNNNSTGDCSATDYCDDTPPQKGGNNGGAYGQNFGSPSYPLFSSGGSSCPTAVNGCMFMNFMDYTNDNSKYMFSPDQATRIQTAMANSPYRKFLGSHNLCSVSAIASVAQFNSLSSACEKSTLVLTNNSSGVPVPTYTWTASGPGSVVYLPDANTAAGVIFDTPGTYVLTLTTDNGSTSVTSKTIVVKPRPIITLSTESRNVCIDEPFDVEASGANTYLWKPDNVTGSGISYYASSDQTYTCIATGSSGCTNSVTVSFAVVNCTGLKDVYTNENRFSIYPNPSHDLLMIQAKQNDADLTFILISDISGKILMSEKLSFNNKEAQVDITSFKKGLYFLKLISENGSAYVTKLVKE